MARLTRGTVAEAAQAGDYPEETMSDARLDGDDDGSAEMDELAHETLEQIAAEVRLILCPVHGTPPRTVVGNGGITLETCCEELDAAVDAAFPEGDEEDPDAE